MRAPGPYTDLVCLLDVDSLSLGLPPDQLHPDEGQDEEEEGDKQNLLIMKVYYRVTYRRCNFNDDHASYNGHDNLQIHLIQGVLGRR